MLKTTKSNFSLKDIYSFDKEDDQSIVKFLEELSLNKPKENDFTDKYLTLNLSEAIDAVISIKIPDNKQKSDRLWNLLTIIKNLVSLNPKVTTNVIIEKGFLSTYAIFLEYLLKFTNWDLELLHIILEPLCNITKNEAIVNYFINSNIISWAVEVFLKIEGFDSADEKLPDINLNLFVSLSTFFTSTLTFEGRKHLNRLCLTSCILLRLNILKTKPVQETKQIVPFKIVKFNFVVIIVSLQNEYICEKLNVLNVDTVQNILETFAFINTDLILQRLKILTKIEFMKEKLFNLNILHWLGNVIKLGNDQEIELGCELMCSLCFNDKVTEYCRNKVDILESIKERLKDKTTNDLTKRYCNQILYLVHQGRVPGLISTLNNEKLSSYDVMISYHHTNVTICSEINDKLNKRSYSTWMDVGLKVPYEQVPYEAVTDAISKASIVVICYCEEYRNNVNCRFEASFAVKHKKPIIFVRVQPDSEPDGWLRSIFNIDLKVDYFNNFQNLDSLHIHIECIRSNAYESPLVKQSSARAALPLYNLSNKDVNTWTCDDTKRWFKENNFEKFIKIFPNCTGITLESFWNEPKENFTQKMKQNAKSQNLHFRQVELDNLYTKLEILFKSQPKKK